MVKIKAMETKVFELIEGEAQFPRNVCPLDGEGIVVWSNEGHGVVVK